MIKKLRKGFFTLSSMTALSMSMVIVAFAEEPVSETDAGNYGTLGGAITSDGAVLTHVDANPDNAILLAGSTQVSSSGEVLVEQQNHYSQRGETSCGMQWAAIHPGAHMLYGVHGVQGGSVNKAYAVYTSTKTNTSTIIISDTVSE